MTVADTIATRQASPASQHRKGDLLGFVSAHHFGSESRLIRRTLVAEYRATEDPTERAMLLEVHDALFANLKQSSGRSGRAKLDVAQRRDQEQMDDARLLRLSRPASWALAVSNVVQGWRRR